MFTLALLENVHTTNEFLRQKGIKDPDNRHLVRHKVSKDMNMNMNNTAQKLARNYGPNQTRTLRVGGLTITNTIYSA
jgi:hypothetical protein